MAAGDFSASYIPDVLVKQEQVWADSRADRELQHPEDALQGVLARQQVSFDPILRGGECVGYKAAWLKSGNTTVVDNSAGGSNLENCNITGDELESVSTTYAPNISLRATYQVKDDECKDLFDAQEKIARGALNAKTQLKKTLSTKLIGILNANGSASNFTIAEGAIHHTLSGVVHQIAPTDWTSDLIAEFMLHAAWNKFNAPYLINGSNFYKDYFLTPYRTDFGNQDAQGAYRQAGIDMVFDPMNVDGVNGTKRTYMVDAGALGFFCKNYNGSVTAEQITADRFRWQERDMSLTFVNAGQTIPVTFDVYMERGCHVKNGTARVPGWTFEYQLNAGIHIAPPDGDSKNGITIFDKVAEVTS